MALRCSLTLLVARAASSREPSAHDWTPRDLDAATLRVVARDAPFGAGERDALASLPATASRCATQLASPRPERTSDVSSACPALPTPQKSAGTVLSPAAAWPEYAVERASKAAPRPPRGDVERRRGRGRENRRDDLGKPFPQVPEPSGTRRRPSASNLAASGTRGARPRARRRKLAEHQRRYFAAYDEEACGAARAPACARRRRPWPSVSAVIPHRGREATVGRALRADRAARTDGLEDAAYPYRASDDAGRLRTP